LKICHDHTEPRVWRHLDAFGKRTEILCALPRGRCKSCQHVWRIPVPWEGEGKHFTRDFEAFALTLMREMPMKKAGEILGEEDTRLWRMLMMRVCRQAATGQTNFGHSLSVSCTTKTNRSCGSVSYSAPATSQHSSSPNNLSKAFSGIISLPTYFIPSHWKQRGTAADP
jgi:hypothetical protein